MFSACVVNKQTGDEVCINFPITKEEFGICMSQIQVYDNVKENIRIKEYYDGEISLHGWMNLDQDIDELNYLANVIEREVDSFDYNKVSAVIEYLGSTYVSEVIKAIERLEDICLSEDIRTHDDLGKYWLIETGCYDIPEVVLRWIDFEKAGYDFEAELGEFTEFGFLETGGICISYSRRLDEIPEEYIITELYDNTEDLADDVNEFISESDIDWILSSVA